MSTDWIQAWPSLQVYPLELKRGDVGGIDTIAHALCQKVRFNGHTKYPMYSVGMHCLIGSMAIEGEHALAFLLHELSEVFLPDIPRPIKPNVYIKRGLELVSWERLEEEHAEVMLEALGLSHVDIYHPKVVDMDLRMLAAEQRDLMLPPPEAWGLPLPPLDRTVYTRDPQETWERFVARFQELTEDVT